MSTDIDLYKDNLFSICAITGHWGARLHVSTLKDGKPVIPAADRYPRQQGLKRVERDVVHDDDAMPLTAIHDNKD